MKRIALDASFMLAGLIGTIGSVLYTLNGTFDHTWGFTLILFFLIILISSVVSITPRFDEYKD
jgi:hypothetical protein